METGKIQVINGAVGAGALVAAATADASTISVMVIGIGGAVTTTLLGAYTAWRAARHRADEADAPLVQSRLVDALEDNAELRQQVCEWKTLYAAAMNRTHPSSGPATGSTSAPTNTGSAN